MPPTKRKATNALDPSERKRAQNRISHQCLREKNITYIRNLEETIELLQKVATGSDPQDRYSVLLDAHLKLIAENRKLEDALLRLRKKLLSFGQAATAAADDEVFDSIFRRRDAENPEAQQSAPRTESVNHETPSALNPSTDNQSFQDIPGQVNQTDIFKDASFLLDLSMAGQEHDALTPSTIQPGDTFLDPAMSSLSPRSLLFVPNQLSITSMSIFGSRLLGACRRHLDNLSDSGNRADMVDRIIKTAVRFSMRCAGLESYAYGVNGAKYIERVISWRLGIGSKNSVPLPFRPTPLQSKNPTHFWGIDLFNWPEIRDQLVLEAESTDFDELLRDLVLHSVIEPANDSVAVNVLDIFENQVLRRRQHQKAPPRSYFTDPSWTLFQIGPEVGEWYSSEHDIVEEAIFQELDRQINAVTPSPDDDPLEESRTNDVAKFLGLDDFFGLFDGQNHVMRNPAQRPKSIKGAQVSILSLDGLTCASCVSDVQDIIGSIPGVLKATVSLGLLWAQVEFNSDVVTEEEIIEAIRSSGYGAHSLPSSESQSWAGLLCMMQEPSNSQRHHVNSCQRDFLVATTASVLFFASRSIKAPWTTQNNYMNLIAYIAVAMNLLAGSELHLEALRSPRHGRRPNMATPASLGIMLALMHAAAADSLQIGINRSYHMDLKSLEPIPILSTSVLGGRLLKAILSQRNRAFASPLAGLVPTMAIVCNKTDEYTSIPIDLLSPGDSVIVNQGEHIPCDGAVESTEPALVTETWINGSLEPRVVEHGDAVNAGGQVRQGSLVSTVRASKFGVRLVTSYARLRSAASAQTILFDKTGTLTHGDLKVTHASFCEEWSSSQKQDILWRAVQEVEAGNTHPVARALFQESSGRLGEKQEWLPSLMVSEFKHELGRGAQAVVTATHPGSGAITQNLAIGSRAYIESLGVAVDLSQIPVQMRNGITTTVVLAIDGKQTAVYVLEDKVRSDAHQVIRQLKDLGLAIGMITGDNAASATSVAREVGIDSDMVFANALPEEKSLTLARFLQRGPAMYVGDNYNDILCFASASFSICVGGLEMQSVEDDCADAMLMASETSPLSRIPLIIRLSRRMSSIVTQNHSWAVFYNILSVVWVLGIFGSGSPSP
ncbi:copper-transporting ATPase 2 [Fusarium subglutinans]|uniref:Copper-transporting ATPase 2 n=1 Tax=Gibberella subglutinans TaxID=42677 RepID=A0A8H5L5H7_GIBSU|nr:copper-transporting ATPase 2 [Fusarium subglutinans]KAF5584446.1 copper-transporting ATPase 2 [Fusarium subglutinans]